jgi:3-oxo-5,6-didehydrosuberyl-CoA/3-oxoadipyl-CoA thiolase
MNDVFICDAARTPIGRYGGALAAVRTDDLSAVPIRIACLQVDAPRYSYFLDPK